MTSSRVFRPLILTFFTASAVLVSQSVLPALDGSWDSDSNGNWHDGSRWTTAPEVPGGVGSIVGLNFNITGNRTITINTTPAVVGRLFIGDTEGSSTYTLAASGGGGLIFDNGAAHAQLLKSSGGADTISSSVVLNSDLDITNATGLNLTLSGVISGNRNISISGNMGNAGSVIFSNSGNTFTGTITVDGTNARLAATSDGRLGNAGNDLTLSNGGSLFVDGATVFGARRQIALAGTGGRIATGNNSGGRYVTVAGNIVGEGGLTIGQTAGSLSGNNSFVQLTGANTFTGGLTVEQGLLRFSSKANLGSTKSITFGSGGGAGLSIVGSAVENLSDFTFTFNSGGPLTFDIQDAGNVFTWDKNYNASFNSSGGVLLTKTGRGTMVITTAQSYNNTNAGGIATALVGGTLAVDYGLGGSLVSGNKVAFLGGTLRLEGSGAGASSQTLGNIRVGSGGGTLIVESNHAGGMTVNLGNFSSLAPQAGGSLNIVTVNNLGTVALTTTGINDASGLLGAGRIIYNGEAFATNATNTSGGAIDAYAGAIFGYGNATVDSMVNFVQYGGATVGASNAYANTLQIEGFGSNDVLDLNGQSLRLTSGGLLMTGDQNYEIANGTLSGAGAGNSDLILHQYSTGTLTIGAVIANGNGNSTLTKAGAGTVVLTAANTYSGQTYINDGVLSIGADNQLGTAGLNLNGGTLQVRSGFTSSRSVSLGGSGGTFDVADGETLVMTGNLTGQTGALTLDNSGNGSGVLQLNGANTFGGGVTINNGVLRLGSDAALGTAGLNPVQFGSGPTATLQINGGRNVTVAGLTSVNGNAVVENGAAGAATLTVNNGADNTFRGRLRDGAAGTLSVVKGGGGVLELTGTNDYTGPTLVAAGTLLVNGSVGETEVTVADGATLAGSGTLGGSTTVQAGGTLSPGNSPGLLTVEAGVHLASASAFVFELTSDTASGRGTNFDGVDVGGALTIETGVTSHLVFNGSGSLVDFGSAFWDSDQSWLVFSSLALSADPTVFGSITTTADSLGAGFSTTGGSLSWRVEGTNVYLDYSAIPEPGTAVLLGLGLATLLFRSSRRRN
jgi:fibronectin-binding autotransporter adhesin